ncbi:MAG: hypothetical protein HC809_06885 [Gammaproteobacteria bacterium]|nr:hypothetical protein [Gammaproteobacteria bacterium]
MQPRIVVIGVVVLVVVAGLLFWWLGGDEPAPAPQVVVPDAGRIRTR